MFFCLLLQGVLFLGVLFIFGGVDVGVVDRNGGGDQGIGVCELELQIDVFYGMFFNVIGIIGLSFVCVVQVFVVSF